MIWEYSSTEEWVVHGESNPGEPVCRFESYCSHQRPLRIGIQALVNYFESIIEKFS